MNQRERDQRQTAACNKLTEYLQSIAILSVQAQNEYAGNPDKISDLLDSIESDLKGARQQVNILWNY